MEARIISIGTLAANPLWGERGAARTGHATTTLITAGDRRILVDPSLPAQALVARLGERARVEPRDITDVFLTSFQPDVRRALPVFDGAAWHIHGEEREAVGVAMAQRLKSMAQRDEEAEEQADLARVLTADVAILQRCRPAPDSLADGVDLFPLPGVTPGMCGLLLAGARHTTLICGDAVPTIEHVEQGKVLPMAVDVDRAKESFKDAIEIADLLILGRDNLVVNPTKRPF